MKKGKIFFLIAFFSFYAEANWFSPGMNLKDKVRLTRELRQQSERNFPSARPVIKDISKNKKIINPPETLNISSKRKKDFRMILDLPLKNRNQTLSKYSRTGFIVLKYFVFSDKEAMPFRWKALTSLARLYPNQSRPIIEAALRSSTWFLRNAGLIAMEIISPQESVRWAANLLNDRALVVRTAAVNMIKKHKASQYKIQLLGKLNASDSFYKNQSLWIRYHIASTLADFCEPGEERMFISFLKDPDERLHFAAITALEKLTGKSFRSSDKNAEKIVAEAQREMWISWWSKSNSKRGAASL